MKKLFFLSLVLAGLGTTASAQLQSKRTVKSTAKTQQNAKRAAEKLQIENQASAGKKTAPKKVVVVTPRAEVMVTQDQK